jgi:integrase/recombinase XerD
MAGRQAKVISPVQLDVLLAHVRGRKDYLRSRVIILLSARAGLRAAEIAQLEWNMVLDPSGKVSHTIEVEDRIAKKKHGRRIPMHADVRTALVALLRRTPDPQGTIIKSRKGNNMRAGSLVNWFAVIYRQVGFDGCSSHTGRRSFLTELSRRTHEAGASLRDVQLLGGHSSISTTERYLDGSSLAQRKLVGLL